MHLICRKCSQNFTLSSLSCSLSTPVWPTRGSRSSWRVISPTPHLITGCSSYFLTHQLEDGPVLLPRKSSSPSKVFHQQLCTFTEDLFSLELWNAILSILLRWLEAKDLRIAHLEEMDICDDLQGWGNQSHGNERRVWDWCDQQVAAPSGLTPSCWLGNLRELSHATVVKTNPKP